ncbi:4Fe-4S dicluster domain-containing protein [Desulfosporosinus sp. Sb-LF]|uniref:4Fe-4S dicluster domain-containing protein n=1 Tax=Desulfosporosinus sp. Sb-LF TaxID=2560027 RepID=UPI00107FAD9C|nr:4Fe-4S dicluster domain-containing protein [Desulfosporosinus sp. Sb-LF]TGE31845.1 4Fe-4S dicluster domain-containing protein [Desulfosporosinus sp. Sb-LF]
MALIEKFATLFGVPEFVVPHMSSFVSDRDMDLVVGMDGQLCSVSEIAIRMECTSEQAQDLLEGCYNKHIVNREKRGEELVYFAADFYERLDYVCKFDENYQMKVGPELRQALDHWCYEVYTERMGPYLESLQNGETVDRVPETFELIENLEELLDSVREIRLVPCNCRKLAGQCTKPTGTCLGFDHSITDRTFGQSLTKEEAKEIVKMAHRKGLMHQVNSDWRTNGLAWICNCCACCCYPTRLALEKGTKGVFPVIQYVAQRDEDKCSHCGACTKRCNFSAFSLGETETVIDGKIRRKVEFDPEQCWGCGICVETCSDKAITMVRVG